MDNWLLIIVGIIFLIGLIVGLVRGAIKIAVSLLATVITFGLVFVATPYVTKAVVSMTPAQAVVEDRIESMISGIVTGGSQQSGGALSAEVVRNTLAQAGIDEAELNALGITIEDIVSGNVTGDDLAAVGISRNLLAGLHNTEGSMTEQLENMEIPRDMQIAAIEGADMPEIFKSLLLTNNNSEIYEKIGATGFVSYVAKYMANLIIHVVSFVLTLIVVTIILRAIIFSLNVISDLPVLGALNRLAGGVLGMVGSLIVVWVIFLIITLLYTTTVGAELTAMIRGNEILSLIYDYNPIMRLATIL